MRKHIILSGVRVSELSGGSSGSHQSSLIHSVQLKPNTENDSFSFLGVVLSHITFRDLWWDFPFSTPGSDKLVSMLTSACNTHTDEITRNS